MWLVMRIARPDQELRSYLGAAKLEGPETQRKEAGPLETASPPPWQGFSIATQTVTMTIPVHPHAPTANGKRIALVLGGGGMKGFAHIGVLQALDALGIRPSLYAGTSIGALLAAAYAGGTTAPDMAQRAISMKRRDLFRLDHLGMIKGRMNAPAIYLESPLRGLVESVVPRGTFSELGVPLFVNTVDLERATQLIFGTPGLQDVNIQDAVYASCALPGFFPPGKVGARYCVDGGVVDNLPVQIAGLWAD